ncbi:SMP-30/gluconolactonase/LRE family protein [Sphaerisporangium sp. NPDC051011]|uniref:SMP-30/gluconolactonase/LRE family protein n=1 Tax=Sphaerisporangium sp. NPDC051011 TaxID=3155792 RepID=UPI0033D15031
MPVSDMPTSPLLEGLRFAEAPRWHRDRLWFSDIFAHRVMSVDISGHAEVVVDLGRDLPSGLGFLPDETMLIVCLNRPVILALSPRGDLRVHADLTRLAVGGLNDMVVDSEGRAYVGSMGTHDSMLPRPLDGDGNVILVEPDGSAKVVADHLDAPNGPCITRDGSTYVVAEFPASRLAGFDRLPDGTLTRRRVWADLRPGSADGITVDSMDAIWVASPRQHECRRVLEGGIVTDRVQVGDRMPLACALGGPDGRTLFVLSAIGGEAAIRDRTCTSVIETVSVDVPAW